MSTTICPRFEGFDIAAPGANTNIMTTSITPLMSCRLRVGVVLETASVFNVTETSGATTNTYGLNESVPLAANDYYVFDVPAGAAYSYNFQVETDGIIGRLTVSEVYV